MPYVLSQSPKAAASVGIKRHCHCLTCLQEKKGAGTRREESRYHFSFVCSEILMQILCYLLKEASGRREGNVRPRTGPAMLWPTWMENCQCISQRSKATGAHSISIKHHGETPPRTSHSTKTSALIGIFKVLQISSIYLLFPVELLNICSILFFFFFL